MESAMAAALHSERVIVEQIHRSLQGEAKSKMVGFGPEASVSSILQLLHQFCSEGGAATGGDSLTHVYAIKQEKLEEVSAFTAQECKGKVD